MDLKGLLEVVYENPMTFHKDFDQWLCDNMEIFTRVRDSALELHSRGRDHYGIATLWEVSRYHTDLKESEGSFKLNNNWRADVAALIVAAYPSLANFFTLRVRTSENLGCYRPGTVGEQLPIFREES